MIPELTHWESYYVIVGSSAAALTGLQFVVMALIADIAHRIRTSAHTVAAFGTPNVVHFSVVLMISAIITAPWHSLAGVAGSTTVVGVAGLLYDLIVVRRAHRQKEYKPEASDWIWYTTLPVLGHAAILLGGLWLRKDPNNSLFVVGGGSLLLLFVGIHNAWDTVTYLVVGHPNAPARKREGEPPPG